MIVENTLEYQALKEIADRQRELLKESLDALGELLPVIQYIIQNGWDEPPLIGVDMDEMFANEMGVTIQAKLARELGDA